MDKAFAVLQHYVAMFEHINMYELYKIYILRYLATAKLITNLLATSWFTFCMF